MKNFLLLTVYCLLLSACAPKGPTTLTVMTHDSFAISEDVVIAFETANNVDVVFLQSGDTGSMLNKAILSKDAPLADVMFGVDNTFLSRALEADIFDAYQSPALSDCARRVRAGFFLPRPARGLWRCVHQLR
jgi:thiamine transport system substrate-binding protein